MKIINIEIRCDVEDEVVTDLLNKICSNHLIAGANYIKTNSIEWVGGQLTQKEITTISGITSLELLCDIEELLPKHCIITSVVGNKARSNEFEHWFSMHL